jgi:hypothetical protein
MAEDIVLGGSSRAIRDVADATVSEGEAQDLTFPDGAPLNCDQHRIAIDLERPFSQPGDMGAPSRRVGGKLTLAHIRPQKGSGPSYPFDEDRLGTARRHAAAHTAAPRDYCLFQSAWHHDQRLRKVSCRGISSSTS